MSNEKREKIVDIVADIRAQNQGLPEDSYALSLLVCDLLGLADRIEAAHKRALAAKDDARLTIVANYETVIAELQRRLRVAEEFATEMKQSTNSLVRSCGHQMILRLQGEGSDNGK